MERAPRPSLVIFDCDGVLVDSEPLSNRIVAESLTRYGLPMTVKECTDLFVGATMRGVMERARAMGAVLPENWVDEVYAETYTALGKGVPLIPGVTDVMDLLDQSGIAMCVASNGAEEKMRISLGQHGLWDRFKGAIFSAHALGVAKPDPALFLAAAKHFDLAPEACVVIEDSPTGAEGARRAGMRCLGYAAAGKVDELKCVGAEIFVSMDEVPRMLSL